MRAPVVMYTFPLERVVVYMTRLPRMGYLVAGLSVG